MPPYHHSKFINEKNSVQYNLVRRNADDPFYNEEDPFTHYMFIPKITNQTKKIKKHQKHFKSNHFKMNNTKNDTEVVDEEQEEVTYPFFEEKEEDELKEIQVSDQPLFPKYSFLPLDSENAVLEDFIFEECTDEELEEEEQEQELEEMETEDSFLSSGNEFMESDEEEMESFPEDGYNYSKHYKTSSHPDAIHISASELPSSISLKQTSQSSTEKSSLNVKDDEVKKLYAALENSEDELDPMCEEDTQADEFFFHQLIQEHRSQEPSFKDQVERDLKQLELRKLQLQQQKQEENMNTIKKTPLLKSKPKQKWYRGVAQFDEIRNDLKGIAILPKETEFSDPTLSSLETEEEEEDAMEEGHFSLKKKKKTTKKNDVDMDTLVCPSMKEWDCMTILTSNTNNIENRPKLLSLKKRKPKPSSSSFSTLEQSLLDLSIHDKVNSENISINKEIHSANTASSSSSSSFNYNHSHTYDNDDEDANEDYNPNHVHTTLPPPNRNASAEEKKEYKRQIKFERKEKRQTKKALKLAFKEEKKIYQRSFALKASQGLL